MSNFAASIPQTELESRMASILATFTYQARGGDVLWYGYLSSTGIPMLPGAHKLKLSSWVTGM